MNLRTVLTITGFAAALPFAFAHDGHEPAAAAATAQAKYPLTTCIVSGDKLGEDGPPVKYTYQQPGKPDRVVEFCCKDCIADFEKDPAKYLARLDAAQAPAHGMKMAAAAGTQSGSCAMKGSCDSGDCELVTGYLPISEALAADDLGKAKSAAATLAGSASHDGMSSIAKSAQALASAPDLAAARASFKALSDDMIPMVKGSKTYVVMNCPMAKADWIQDNRNVRNPYLGKSMPTCGAPKE